MLPDGSKGVGDALMADHHKGYYHLLAQNALLGVKNNASKPIYKLFHTNTTIL